MQKLILGTAQFGSDYGIKHDGQPSIEEIEKIAKVAWDGGIRIIHTSWEYDLPKICETIFGEFEWITKYSDQPKFFSVGEYGPIGKTLYKPTDLIDWDFHEGYFHIDDADCEIIQIPINILDNRFLTQKVKEYTKAYEIHARSVFLQGLLLMDILSIPRWVPKDTILKLSHFQQACAWKGLKLYEAALGWVLGLKDVDHVIVGVNSAGQLKQLLKVKPLQWDYDFSIQDENILDPRKWPKDV